LVEQSQDKIPITKAVVMEVALRIFWTSSCLKTPLVAVAAQCYKLLRHLHSRGDKQRHRAALKKSAPRINAEYTHAFEASRFISSIDTKSEANGWSSDGFERSFCETLQ
jgi:hypothetical protein